MQATDTRQQAYRRMRLMTLIAIIGSFIAAAWDAWWHTQYAFEGFFSPPHVFGYGVALVLAWLINDTVLSPVLRPHFRRIGEHLAEVPVPILRFRVPGVLVILGAGVVVLGFAGLVLDNIWHTAFGLNETGWSFPHAMIGWALLLIIFGLLASRMALGELSWGYKIVFGWLILVMCIGVIAGPFTRNQSPDMVEAERQTPVYLQQPETQHLFRIYLNYNLTRTNPAIMVLIPLGAAAGLAFVRKLDKRVWLMLGVALIVSVSGGRAEAERLAIYDPDLLLNPVNTAALPVIWLAGGLVVLQAVRVPERWAWALAGILFAFVLHGRYDIAEAYWWIALLAPIPTLVGVAFGEYIYRTLTAPHSWRVILPFVGIAVLFPLLTGLIDLYWRLNTP